MTHGIHGHGKGHHFGIQRHGSGQFKKAGSGEHKKLGKAGSGEHKKLEKAGVAPAGQSGGINEAMAALDQAIKNLAVSLNKDSYNGQEAPAGVQPVSSGATNPGNIQADSYVGFQPLSGSLQSAPAPTAPGAAGGLSLKDPLLEAKGGGGVRGGVIGSFLDTVGGGGVRGGVIGS